MKIGYLLLIVAALFVVGTANAFEMVLSTDTVSIHTGETKTLEIGVVSVVDDVVIFASPIEQPWMSMPTHIFVNASQQATAAITFAPFDRTEPKLYTFNLVLQSLKTGEKRERMLTIAVRSAQVAIEDMTLSGNFEPAGWGQLDIFVKNYENTTASITLNANAGGFLRFSEDVTLAAGEFKQIKRGFTIPECQQSGEYSVLADIQFRNEKVFSADSSFVIPEKFIPTTTKSETGNLLSSETVVTVKNGGNVGGITEYSDNVLGSLFFSGDKPTRTDDGFRWSINVGACQTVAIRYTIDYTPIPVAIFIIFAIWYVFFRLRTVTIKKLILQKSTIEKGLEFTVGVDVKSYVGAKDIEIRDFVPSLFDIRDTAGIKPVKRKTEAGTEMVWRFKDFKTYEERILDYKIIPLFSITGQVNLPKASVSFTYLGRRITKSSAPTAIGLKLVTHVERAGSCVDWANSVLKGTKKK